MQKNQLTYLQKLFETDFRNLPVFGINNVSYDINVIKSYLPPILVNKRDSETTLIQKVNKIVSFKFDNFQIFENLNFLKVATNPDFSQSLQVVRDRRIFFLTKSLTSQMKRTTKNFVLT